MESVLCSAAAGLPHDPVMIAAMAAGLALRLLAIRYRWNMPRFVYTRDLHSCGGPSDVSICRSHNFARRGINLAGRKSINEHNINSEPNLRVVGVQRV
jgi:hypothetical protein